MLNCRTYAERNKFLTGPRWRPGPKNKRVKLRRLLALTYVYFKHQHKRMNNLSSNLLLLAAAVSLLGPGCSIRRLAVNKVGNALAGSGTMFAADDDPELVKAAAPFSLKLMEACSTKTRGIRA